MNTTTVRTRLVLVLAPLVFAVLGATSSALACVVGTGTIASCTEAALNACLPGGASFDGTVTFACGDAAAMTGITVTSTKIISADTTIDGGSAGIAISSETVGLFSVTSGITFTVENTIENYGAGGGCNAVNGGAISNAGTLSVTNSDFSGVNCGGEGGAIDNRGTATVTNCFFGDNSRARDGGAINNSGTLSVTNSIFGSNDAVDGGAIANAGTLSVTNSTFSQNVADFSGAINNSGTLSVTNSTFGDNGGGDGGAIRNFGHGTVTVTNSGFFSNAADANGGGGSSSGGAINSNTDGTLSVTNSTFWGNIAGIGGGAIQNSAGTLSVTNSTFSVNDGPYGGAIQNSGGAATVTNSTFSQNGAEVAGGAILAAAPVKVVNSILANSYSGGNCSVSGGSTITDGGHNIDDKATCAFSTANGSLNNTDPKLATALENNGGPTQTLAIGAMSPAINAGNETVCAAPPVNNLDQRGFVRPGMGATNCSIGAYEFNAAPSATTTTSTTTPSTTITLPCTSARCTLGAARTSAACAGQTIPASVTGKFSTAETLIDQAASNSGRKAQRLLKKAKMALKKAEAKASRAAKGKHAKISSNCAMALKGAAEGVIAGLGV